MSKTAKHCFTSTLTICESSIHVKGFRHLITNISRYGYSQRQKLPVGSYKFMERWEIDSGFDKMLKNYNQESDGAQQGFIAEVDLSYPAHLHHIHQSFPLAPHQFKPSKEDLSPYQTGVIPF